MTQAEAILERLERGETVTPRLAYELTGSLACHSRIAELRARGHRIRCTIRSDGGKRWGEYTLERDPPRGQADLFEQTCSTL